MPLDISSGIAIKANSKFSVFRNESNNGGLEMKWETRRDDKIGGASGKTMSVLGT